MGKSVTAQALASQAGARSGLASQALDPAAVVLPLAATGSVRRAAGAVKTPAVKTRAPNTAVANTAVANTAAAKTVAKAVAETAQGASRPTRNAGANKAAPSRASGDLKAAKGVQARADQARSERRRMAEQSDVLVSAVISTYLLTHLHHVLQRAEFGAQQEGRTALAANYAQLRKVLCLDARTMEDASASGQPEDAPQAA